MSSPETVSGKIGMRLLDKADRLFRNDNPGIWIEILQNARRADATAVEITIEEQDSEPASCIVTVHDNGRGIGDFQDLLTLGSSGWREETQVREDPAGMGFFALCRSDVEVQSGRRSVTITPSVFLGKSEARIHELPEAVQGARIRFTRESTKQQLIAALEKTAEFCPVEVRLNGTTLPRHDFLEGALCREVIDGIEIGFATAFFWDHRSYADDNWNFYGARIRGAEVRLTGLLQPDCVAPHVVYARFNVLDTARIKLQLPDRKGIIEDQFYKQFLVKARAAAYRFFRTQERHALSFKDWNEAKELGVLLPEAAYLLRSWHATPQDDNEEPLFGTCRLQLLPNVSDVVLVDRDLENTHTLEGALQTGAVLDGKLFFEDREFAGYSWYDRLPRIVDTAVFLNGIGYEDWALASGRPTHIEVEVTIAENNLATRRQRLNAFIHVDSNGQIWNEPCFVAVVNSPWDNPELHGPFAVVRFIMSATFCPSDDSGSDSWETQKDRYEEDVCRETNAYFRGPRETLLAILHQALDYDACTLAEDLGIKQIRFTRADGSRSWSVDLVDATEPA